MERVSRKILTCFKGTHTSSLLGLSNLWSSTDRRGDDRLEDDEPVRRCSLTERNLETPPALPPAFTLSPFSGGASLLTFCVEADEMDEISESSPPPKRPVAVVLVLFFLGSGGRTLPGSSSRRSL